jgi:hypothetical protein
MKALKWTTVKRRVKDLIPLGFNPRSINEEGIEKLKKSFEKFNLAEIPIINHDNTLIGGNQRVKVLMLLGRGEEVIDVRYPNRQLTEHELKEYALTSNSHMGEWDASLLNEHFGDFDLNEFNIDLKELEEEEEVVQRPRRDPGPAPAEQEKRWFVYVDCVNEKEAQKVYDEMVGRGFETKVVN